MIKVIYCAGQIIVCVTAIEGVTGIPPHWWGIALGLSLVGLGTGRFNGPENRTCCFNRR